MAPSQGRRRALPCRHSLRGPGHSLAPAAFDACVADSSSAVCGVRAFASLNVPCGRPQVPGITKACRTGLSLKWTHRWRSRPKFARSWSAPDLSSLALRGRPALIPPDAPGLLGGMPGRRRTHHLVGLGTRAEERTDPPADVFFALVVGVEEHRVGADSFVRAVRPDDVAAERMFRNVGALFCRLSRHFDGSVASSSAALSPSAPLK